MKNNRRRKLTIFFLVAVVAIAIGLNAFRNGGGIAVKTILPGRGVVEQIVTATSVGTLEARRDATISSESAGVVKKILHREGAIVKSSDAVIEIDAAELDAEKLVVENEINAATLHLQQASLTLEKLKADLGRIAELEKKKIAAAHELEDIEKEREIAEKEVDVQKATIHRFEAHRELVNLKISKTRVRVPFSGVVTTLFVEEGEYVQPGRPLFFIVEDSPLVVRAPIDEVDTAKLKTGLDAVIEFDALPERKIKGTVVEVLPAVSTDRKNNRTLDVKVKPTESLPQLRTGISAKVSIVVDRSAPNAIFVPTNVIFLAGGGKEKYVYIVEGGKARKRKISTGLENWETTEVREGLSESDRVIVPLETLEEATIVDGTRIEPHD